MEDMYSLLEEKYHQYNTTVFIDQDPVSIPHRFTDKENIEISGFLAASLAWGQRPVILKKTMQLISLMDNNPYQFIMQADRKDSGRFDHFCHRTFNTDDIRFFIHALQHIYKNYHSLEYVITEEYRLKFDLKDSLIKLRKLFFEPAHPKRTEKHVSDILKGASAKRLNMFLRWMIRKDDKGVDFGLWKEIPPSALYIPLDVHTGRTARYFGLLKRQTNDWKAVEELTNKLKEFDPNDPVKYDFALFGMGIFEEL